MVLHPAGERQIPEIVRIYNLNPTFLLHHLGVSQVTPAFIRGEQEEMARVGFTSSIVYSKAGQRAVGVCDFKDGGCAYLSLLMVDRLQAGRGLGKAIYAGLEQHFIAHHAQSVRIDVVTGYPGNPLGFWLKQGFTPMEETELCWGGKKSRAQVLRKPLAPLVV